MRVKVASSRAHALFCFHTAQYEPLESLERSAVNLSLQVFSNILALNWLKSETGIGQRNLPVNNQELKYTI